MLKLHGTAATCLPLVRKANRNAEGCVVAQVSQHAGQFGGMQLARIAAASSVGARFLEHCRARLALWSCIVGFRGQTSGCLFKDSQVSTWAIEFRAPEAKHIQCARALP